MIHDLCGHRKNTCLHPGSYGENYSTSLKGKKNHIVEFIKIHSPVFEKLVLLHIIKDLVMQTRLLAHLGGVI